MSCDVTVSLTCPSSSGDRVIWIVPRSRWRMASAICGMFRRTSSAGLSDRILPVPLGRSPSGAGRASETGPAPGAGADSGSVASASGNAPALSAGASRPGVASGGVARPTRSSCIGSAEIRAEALRPCPDRAASDGPAVGAGAKDESSASAMSDRIAASFDDAGAAGRMGGSGGGATASVDASATARFAIRFASGPLSSADTDTTSIAAALAASDRATGDADGSAAGTGRCAGP
jgi:hypothetical protein